MVTDAAAAAAITRRVIADWTAHGTTFVPPVTSAHGTAVVPTVTSAHGTTFVPPVTSAHGTAVVPAHGTAVVSAVTPAHVDAGAFDDLSKSCSTLTHFFALFLFFADDAQRPAQ